MANVAQKMTWNNNNNTNNNNNNNNNNKYVAPNKRQTASASASKTASASMSLDQQSFPTLKEMLTTVKHLHPRSFASVAQKVEAVVEVKPKVSEVSPGWIHIRKNKNTGRIEFNYNRTDRNTSTMEDVIYEEKRLSKYLFTRRVTLQQWERDFQNEMLGDLSPYWNKKTILEMHEDEDYQEGDYDENDNIYNDNHSDNSDN